MALLLLSSPLSQVSPATATVAAAAATLRFAVSARISLLASTRASPLKMHRFNRQYTQSKGIIPLNDYPGKITDSRSHVALTSLSFKRAL